MSAQVIGQPKCKQVLVMTELTRKVLIEGYLISLLLDLDDLDKIKPRLCKDLQSLSLTCNVSYQERT